MNYIDIVILLFLLYGAFRGFSKGLIIEVATLAGLILGVFIAIRYSPFTEGILKDFLNITSRYLSYIALAVTFLLADTPELQQQGIQIQQLLRQHGIKCVLTHFEEEERA